MRLHCISIHDVNGVQNKCNVKHFNALDTQTASRLVGPTLIITYDMKLRTDKPSLIRNEQMSSCEGGGI